MFQGHFIYSTDIFFLTTFSCKENLLTCSCFCTKMHITADCGLNVSCHLHVSWKHVFCKCSTSHRDFLNLLWTDFLYIYLIAVFSLKIGCVLERSEETVSSLLHKQVLFSLFNALTVNRSFYLQDWIFQTSRMATGGYEAATSMIHRRRAPLNGEKIELGLNIWSDYLFFINALCPLSSGWIFGRLKIRDFF